MVYILFALLVIATFVIIMMGKLIERLQTDLQIQKQNYDALDKGTQELEEGYQQEILSLDETIEWLHRAVGDLKREHNELIDDRDSLAAVVARHEDQCLKRFEDIVLTSEGADVVLRSFRDEYLDKYTETSD